jgi:hypothetical protein
MPDTAYMVNAFDIDTVDSLAVTRGSSRRSHARRRP